MWQRADCHGGYFRCECMRIDNNNKKNLNFNNDNDYENN